MSVVDKYCNNGEYNNNQKDRQNYSGYLFIKPRVYQRLKQYFIVITNFLIALWADKRQLV